MLCCCAGEVRSGYQLLDVICAHLTVNPHEARLQATKVGALGLY
jgi:hypothetical protein